MAPRALLDRKPPHGAPCTRCGLCCIAVVCPLGQFVLKRDCNGPCPALSYDDKGSVCGMVADPERFAPEQTARHGVDKMRAAATLIIGSGTGCDARFNGEPTNDAFNVELRKWDVVNADAIREAVKTWHGSGSNG